MPTGNSSANIVSDISSASTSLPSVSSAMAIFFAPIGNIAPVWVTSNTSASNSVSSLPNCPTMDGDSGVSEVCVKEAMICEVSPLGFHLSLTIKEKIWIQEYVDILSLLPSTKEVLKSEKKSDDKDDERKRVAPKSFYNWVQAFSIYSSVLGEKHPHLCSGLFRHLESISEAHKNFGGNAWYTYDEMFRQKLAVYLGVKWGTKDVGLWLNLMLPQRNPPNKTQTQSLFRKGLCFAVNNSQCKCNQNCRYKHECAYCAGAHPASKCFKKAQSSRSSSKKKPRPQ